MTAVRPGLVAALAALPLVVACDAGPDDGDDGLSESADVAACGEVLPVAGLGRVRDLTVDANAAYVLESAEADQEVVLRRISRGNGAGKVLGRFPASVIVFGERVQVSGDHVYVGLDDGLWRVSRAGGEPVRLATDAVEDLAIDDGHVYWSTDLPDDVDQPDRRIRRAAHGGQAIETVIDSADEQDLTIEFSTRVAVDATHVYWHASHLNPQGLLRRPKAGGAITTAGAWSGDGVFELVATAGGLVFGSSALVEGHYDVFQVVNGAAQRRARLPAGAMFRIRRHGDDLVASYREGDRLRRMDDPTQLLRLAPGRDPAVILDGIRAFDLDDDVIVAATDAGLIQLPVGGCPR